MLITIAHDPTMKLGHSFCHVHADPQLLNTAITKPDYQWPALVSNQLDEHLARRIFPASPLKVMTPSGR